MKLEGIPVESSIRKDNHKIAFVTACSNERCYQECLAYLRQLEVPDGFLVEYIPIWGAYSMAAAYNEALSRTNAKYKVYLHQDMFLINRRILKEMLNVFYADALIGMIGVTGGRNLPGSGRMATAWNCGRVFVCNGWTTLLLSGDEPSMQSGYIEVEAIDGMLMMTCRDLYWREELFDGWDFYDISQCFEFRRRGMKVVIPWQGETWGFHDCGQTNYENYEKYRIIAKKEYKDFLGSEEVSEAVGEAVLITQSKQIISDLINLINHERLEIVDRVISAVMEKLENVKGVDRIKCLTEIYELEKACEIHPYFNELFNGFQAMSEKFDELKYMFRRLEYNIPEAKEEVRILLEKKDVSMVVLCIVIFRSCWDTGRLKSMLEQELRCMERRQDAAVFEAIWTLLVER